MNASKNEVLIVGSMAFDDLELPSGSHTDVVGGSATYASIACSLLAPTRIVGVVGEDFPADTLHGLKQRGIDIEGVEQVKGKTFRWKGRYAKDLASRETLDTQLNVFADFRPKIPAAYRSSPYLFLGNIHPALQLEVLSQVERPRFVAADTMNFWIQGERELLLQVLQKIDMLVINDEELRLLAQDHNLKRGAKAVRQMGPKRLIVKRGDAGALLFDQEETFFSPAIPLEHEVDPTGAGDTFAGALMGHFARASATAPTVARQAVVTGSAVASFCVQGVGATEVLKKSAADVDARIDVLKGMLRAEH